VPPFAPTPACEVDGGCGAPSGLGEPLLPTVEPEIPPLIDIIALAPPL
jgi:hypothetical protein